MRTFLLSLALSGSLLLAGCGDHADPTDVGEQDAGETHAGPTAGAGIALEGAGWDGFGAFDPTTSSEKTRVIAFLNPMWGSCQREAGRLEQQLAKEGNLEVVGATSAGQDALGAFRESTGASFPILYGATRATLDAYGIQGTPSLVVLDADGGIAGRSEADIQKALAAAK